MDKSDLDRHAGAYSPEFKFHDENLWMLSWYVERMIRAVRLAKAETLISLGIGHSVVSQKILASLASSLKQYTIVEGSPLSIQEFRARTPLPGNVQVVNAFFEEFEAAGPVDAVEMGFVLEHVDDPALVLRRFAGFLRPGGTLVVVVPNARSLHRLFGKAAGLLDNLYRLSEQDLELGHKRYFDLTSITQLVLGAGLRIVNTEGVFLKCLTTAQLQSLHLAPEIVRSFFEVGVSYPEVSNALYIEARA